MEHVLSTRHVAELFVRLSNHCLLPEVAATLGPLVPRMKTLFFYNFTFVSTEWREMEALQCSVCILRFYNCKLPAEMLALFAGSAELQELLLARCTFTEEWVVDMAAVRSAPLTLNGFPELSSHIVAQCRVAAERAHGAQRIKFAT